MKGGVGRLASNWMRTTKGADGGLVVCVCVCVAVSEIGMVEGGNISSRYD